MKHSCCTEEPTAPQMDLTAGENELRLIDDLVGSMDRADAEIAEVAVGAHFIGIRAEDGGTETAELASTLGFAPTAEEKKMVDSLIGKTVGATAELLNSVSGFSISLGAAALNSGITPPDDQPDIEASLIMAEKGKKGETVIVGDFPFTDGLRERIKRLHLLELQDVPGRTAPDQWDAVLARCRVLGLTGTTLITRAMAAYLAKAPQAYTIIIGPTTPLTPAFFSHGANVLAGCRVVNASAVFEGIRKGWHFRPIKPLGVAFIAWSDESR